MFANIPVYFRDESTHEFRADVPTKPGEVVRAATVQDLRRKLKDASPGDDSRVWTDLFALSKAWEEPYDPNSDTLLLPR